jgi:hypothetical protein
VPNVRQELQSLCSVSPPGYRDYPKYLRGRATLDYGEVKRFLSQTLLGKYETVFFPTRLEMSSSYWLIPTHYLSLIKAPESIDALYFIYANYRVQGILKKLLKLYKDDIENVEEGVGREPYHIRLRTGQRIPVPYHGKKWRLCSCENCE